MSEHLRHALRQAWGVTDMGSANAAHEGWRPQEPRRIDVGDLDAIAARHFSQGRAEGAEQAFRDAQQHYEVDRARMVASALDAIGGTLLDGLVSVAEQATAAKGSTRKSILEAVQRQARLEQTSLLEIIERVRKGEL